MSGKDMAPCIGVLHPHGDAVSPIERLIVGIDGGLLTSISGSLSVL
jgi:hypothetical protein